MTIAVKRLRSAKGFWVYGILQFFKSDIRYVYIISWYYYYFLDIQDTMFQTFLLFFLNKQRNLCIFVDIYRVRILGHLPAPADP